VLSYLKASRLHLGLLITFNVPQLRRGYPFSLPRS
jgi:hypothetical protein